MAITWAEVLVGGGGFAMLLYGLTTMKDTPANKTLAAAGAGGMGAIVLEKILGSLGQPVAVQVRYTAPTVGVPASYNVSQRDFLAYREASFAARGAWIAIFAGLTLGAIAVSIHMAKKEGE